VLCHEPALLDLTGEILTAAKMIPTLLALSAAVAADPLAGPLQRRAVYPLTEKDSCEQAITCLPKARLRLAESSENRPWQRGITVLITQRALAETVRIA
jgi:hypothetical protein